MKVKIYLLLLLFFFSCDSGVDSNSLISSDGIIKKIEGSSWMYGSHTLNDSQGKLLYALTSSKYDLDKYIDKKVYIIGNKVDGCYPIDGGPVFVDVSYIKYTQ